LYQGYYQGQRLRPGDQILSFDAKPQIQARGRHHATVPAAPGKPVRVEHEYTRHGALALLAGMDVRTGMVFASTPATTGITPFMDLACQVMARPEYKNAPGVFIIVDNGSDHRGQAAIGRLASAHPNAIMIHTPVHASWLNQIGDLLLHRPEEGRLTQPLRQPRRPLRNPAGLRAPLQPHRPPVQLEVHRRRPARTPPSHQQARTPGPATPTAPRRRLTTPDEITVSPTKPGS